MKYKVLGPRIATGSHGVYCVVSETILVEEEGERIEQYGA
jgi:hypothetical protein